MPLLLYDSSFYSLAFIEFPFIVLCCYARRFLYFIVVHVFLRYFLSLFLVCPLCFQFYVFHVIYVSFPWVSCYWLTVPFILFHFLLCPSRHGSNVCFNVALNKPLPRQQQPHNQKYKHIVPRHYKWAQQQRNITNTDRISTDTTTETTTHSNTQQNTTYRKITQNTASEQERAQHITNTQKSTNQNTSTHTNIA